MKLSPDQSTALDRMKAWLLAPDKQYFVLAGYAGSGKTTIVQEFINALTRPAICCAPTGKAASVLRRRLTSTPVTTIHRVLYKPVPPPSPAHLRKLEAQLALLPDDEKLLEEIAEERFRLEGRGISFARKDNENRVVNEGDLVIVDEASMVTRKMLADFIATGAFILFVGDPGQLPPVQSASFFEEAAPDALLTEIHRQAADSPILQLSLRIRKGDSIAPFQKQGCAKMPKTEMPYDDWLKYDQVITGSNQSRRRINRFFRKVQGRTSDYPQKGDKLICLKNAEELFFINGVMSTAVEDFDYVDEISALIGVINYEGDDLDQRTFDDRPFQQNYNPDLKERPFFERSEMDALEFDYAYGITVHKSQGSEWDRVIIADDFMNFQNAEFRRRWLYTAVTRAKKELVWLF